MDDIEININIDINVDKVKEIVLLCCNNGNMKDKKSQKRFKNK